MSLSDQEGDFRALLERNHVRWSGVARSYAPAAEREDLLQEILMQVWKSLPGFSGRSTADTWAYRVALNTAMAWVRKSRSRQADLNTHSADVDQLAGGLGSDTRDAIVLDEFLASLSKIDRAVMLLFLDAVPNAEAAEITGMSEGAVRVRLHRIRKQFEDSWCNRESSDGL